MGIVNFFLRRLFTGTFKQISCSNLAEVREVTPEAGVCLKCVELGDTWPKLRVCMTCGHVGCCEQAKNQHALRHFQETGHPIMKPFEQDIIHRWMWCYVDEALIDLPAVQR